MKISDLNPTIVCILKGRNCRSYDQDDGALIFDQLEYRRNFCLNIVTIDDLIFLFRNNYFLYHVVAREILYRMEYKS